MNRNRLFEGLRSRIIPHSSFLIPHSFKFLIPHSFKFLILLLSSFIIHNSAWADSFKCGMEAAEKIAASTAAAAKGTALAKAVDAIVEDDFEEEGEREAALKVIRDAIATTDAKSGDAGHLRRYLYSIAAGIQPGHKGGWDDFELAPQPQKWLKFVEAEKDTPKGKIKSAWKYDASGKCQWTFTIPDGAKATVCVNGMCKPHSAGEYKLVIREE